MEFRKSFVFVEKNKIFKGKQTKNVRRKNIGASSKQIF